MEATMITNWIKHHFGFKDPEQSRSSVANLSLVFGGLGVLMFAIAIVVH